MARNVTVYFADGSRHEYQGVPDDAMPEQIAARAGRDFQGKQIRHLERAPAPEPERTLGGYTKEAFKGLIPGLVGLGETAITGAASLLPEGAEQAVRKPVEEFATGVRETFAPAPGYEDTLVRKISEGVGSTLPFLPLGALGLAGRVGAAGLGVSVGAGEARQRAEESEATEGQRGVATALGTIPGALEALPPIRILRRFGFGDEAIKEVAGVAPALGRIAKSGGEEALQEASSQVLQNLIAKGVYAPDEAVFGGVGEAATVGGGAGAVVSAIAELALGRRLRGPEGEPTTKEAPPEEPPPDLTPEQLAPKPGRAAKTSPVRAKTLDELRGQIPAAPVAEVKTPKGKAPVESREPMAFERTKEPTPEALQEAAEFVTQFPEGSKNFDLFKAKSIAKKLGYEGIPKKGVFRIDIEPLLRRAITPRETITPAEDTVVGQNAAGEQLYERQDGSRYRMRLDRPDRTAGYPDFGGDLAPVETTLAAVTPVSPAETVTPTTPPAAPVEPAKVQKAPSQGIVGEESPEAIASLRAAAENPDTPILESSGYKPPPWDELPNGFGVRQYILEGKEGRSVVQEIRAPVVGEKEPAVIRRGIDYDGTPFGEKEATGTLDEIYSGVAFSDFNDYFAAKNRTAIAPPTTPPEAPRGTEPVASETVGGAGARGAELPVSRASAEGRGPAGIGTEGLGVPSAPAARVDERKEGVKPALKKARYKEEGEPYDQGISFNYGNRHFELGAAAGMFSRPILIVTSKNGDRIGDHYANNERRQVDARVGDASQIGQYDLPPDIANAINDYLFSYSKGKEAVTAAGRKIADSINSEMAKYEPAARVDEREKGVEPALKSKATPPAKTLPQKEKLESLRKKQEVLREQQAPLLKQRADRDVEWKKMLDQWNAADEAQRATLRPVMDAMILEGRKLKRRIDRLGERIGLLDPRYNSIDVLNRTAPDLAEQTRDRAPSLRVGLKKAKKDYDAGVLTGDQLAETTGNLLLKTQKERIVQPRKRGADYIRERLMNARRTGAISQEGVDLAEWFIRQNPLLVDDLGISIRQQPTEMEGTAGFYNNISRVITLFKGAGDSQTATHEILHHLERLMPSNIRSGILKAYVKQLTKAAKNAKTDAEKAFFEAITNYHYFSEANKNAEYKKALDAIESGKVPASYYQYVNPSEFWAVNGARIVQGRYGIPPGIVGQLKRWLRDFLEKAKDVFGLKSDAAIIRALDSLAKADGKYQTDRMLAEAPGYRSVGPTKTGKAKPTKPKKSMAELRREASAKMMKPGIVRQAINSLTGPTANFETVAKNFQNVNRMVKKIQEDLRVLGRLVYVGDKKNNIDDQMSAAANRASYIVATEVEPVTKRLRESIASYARVMEGTIKDALEKIDSYRIALHEPERRETKYLRNVPLNNTTKEEFLPGEPAMTAADARAALEERRSLAKDKAQAEAIQDMMRYLAANYADPRGYSPVKARLEEAGKPSPEEMTTDFYDDIYNVIGTEYTQEELDAAREEYEGLDPETKSAVDTVFADLDALHELNKNLNRRANYWTDKVDRVVESYGWKHYVPFKGSPRADKTFDTDTEYLSGELSETAESFEGRRTNFDSPVLQSIAESYFAASRAGRGTDVTTTIKNLIELGVIDSKKMKKFSFEERNALDFDYNQVRGRDKVLHYNEDGSVEVYTIKNPDLLEAIKTPFREMNWAVKAGNALTSALGQSHTRFNPAFPPMDFIRNSITNAGLISAREGGKQAREYLTAVAASVARLGFFKAGKLSNRLAKNDTVELDRLAKKHPFYRDALEMMKYGGRTMYRMSFNISDTMEELQKQVGPKKILSEGNQVWKWFTKWVDAYNDAFEMTSRVAAYTVRKQQNIAEAKAKNLNVADPKVMEDINKEAAAFALSLMDFRKIGKYGRELGAWFMFIRPASTGAVDAIDALRPGFFLKPESAVEKGLARLEPEIKELFETQSLAEEIKRIQGNKRPDKKKIAALEQEIATREKSFDTFEKNQLTRAKNARNTALFTLAAGAALYGMAASIAGDDDEGRNRVTTDDMSRWTRYLRLPVIGDDGFFQIPWGFGVSALMSAGAQTAAVASGASSFKDYAGNMVEIGMDSFLPIPTSRINPIESFENFGAWLIDSATPSAARPLVEFVLNVDAMGNPIYNSRSGKYADAFSGSTRPSELHRQITETVFNITDGKVSVSPDTVAFVLNNYADAPNHIADNSYNLFLTATGDKEFDAKKDTMLLRSFIGRNSNYDARQFSEAEKDVKKLAQQLKTFEDLGTPEQVDKFFRKNPNADILVEIYNKGNGSLNKLRNERKQIMLDRSLTPKQRDQMVDLLRIEENYIKKLFVDDFKAYSGS